MKASKVSKLLYVEWIDAYSTCDNSWHSDEQVDAWLNDIGIHKDVGYVVRQNKRYIVLALYSVDASDEIGGYHRELAIPKKCIVYQEELHVLGGTET